MDKAIKIDLKNIQATVPASALDAINAEAVKALNTVDTATGAGNDFLGWVKLPSETTQNHLNDIKAAAERLAAKCEYVVCIGIGGSYLGAKAVVEALSNAFASYCESKRPHLLFAGQNIGEDYLYELQQLLKGKKFGIVVISKSGTTTEPAIAFRLLKEQLEDQAGKKEASELIIAITDEHRGALRKLATEEGYTTFVIAD
ncbi:MAG: glucose-6-phosphate isomerase, partial [Muribaculaceae bacterium]|nr:glucose-6-phosphate isomerase [Muribaculaceae bacterium]